MDILRFLKMQNMVFCTFEKVKTLIFPLQNEPFLEFLTHCESSDSFPDEDEDVPGGSFNWI